MKLPRLSVVVAAVIIVGLSGEWHVDARTPVCWRSRFQLRRPCPQPIPLIEQPESPFLQQEPPFSLDRRGPPDDTRARNFRYLTGQDAVAVLDTKQNQIIRRRIDAGAPVVTETTFSFAGDGRRLLGAILLDGFWVWDVPTGKEIVAEAKAIGAVTLAPDGETVAVGSKSNVTIFDVGRHQVVANLEGHLHPVKALAFSADSALLASGAGTVNIPASEGEVFVWSPRTGKRLFTVDAEAAPQTLAFSPDGTMLAIGWWNGRVTIWDMEKREARFTVTLDGSATCFAFSPDSRTLAVGDTRGRVRLWNTANGKEQPSQLGHEHAVTSLAFAADGKTYLSADLAGRVILWDRSGDQLQDWPLKNVAAAVAPDARHVVVLSSDAGILRLVAAKKQP